MSNATWIQYKHFIIHVCVNFCQIGLKATWKALSKPTDFSIHYQVLYFHRIENPWVLMMHGKLVMNTLPSEYNYLSSSGTSLWPEGSLGPLPLHPSQLNQNTDTKQHITTKYLHSSKIKIIYIQEIKSTHAMKLNKISNNQRLKK